MNYFLGQHRSGVATRAALLHFKTAGRVSTAWTPNNNARKVGIIAQPLQTRNHVITFPLNKNQLRPMAANGGTARPT